MHVQVHESSEAMLNIHMWLDWIHCYIVHYPILDCCIGVLSSTVLEEMLSVMKEPLHWLLLLE